jgi:hypothetical protein
VTISGTPVFSGTITPSALGTAALIQPVGGATLGWVGNVFQGTGIYVVEVDLSVMASGDQVTLTGKNQLLPSGAPEVEIQQVYAAPPGLALQPIDAMIVQYGAIWSITQTAGTLRSFPVAVYRLDAGLAGPVAKGTLTPTNTTTNNLLATISTPGVYILSASVKNMIAGDTAAIWETTSVLTSGAQENPSQNNPSGAVAAGAPTILKNDPIVVGAGCTASFFLKQTALGAGHSGVFPGFDWSITQLG